LDVRELGLLFVAEFGGIHPQREAAALDRLRLLSVPFAARLVRAAAAIAAGDGSMIASPLKDSYHTIWFELHEELIHLSGRNRATEEARSARS